MSSDDFYYISQYWPLARCLQSPGLCVSTSWNCWPVTRCPGEARAAAHHHLHQGQVGGPGHCHQQDRLGPGQTSFYLIKIYGNRIQADLGLNIDGSDWVGCAGQMENNKLCRKFFKSVRISQYLHYVLALNKKKIKFC